VPLGGYILVKERTANFHKLWDFAMEGHKLARAYLVLIGLAFALAVVAWLFAFTEQRAAKKVAVAAPNPLFQPTAFGGG
jgi:hypothetical protein